MSRKDASGVKRKVNDSPTDKARSMGWNYGDDEGEEQKLDDGQIHRLKR